jgi:predicted phosphodiesterase
VGGEGEESGALITYVRTRTPLRFLPFVIRHSSFILGTAFLLSALLLRADHILIGCIGDYGSGTTNAEKVARLVKSWKPDFIITLGDNNYPVGAEHTIDRNIGQFYHEFIHPYRGFCGAGAATNRFFPCLGNHDYLTNNARPYFDFFTLPGNGRYYTHTHGPVQIFCLNMCQQEPDGVTNGSVQAQWLKQELAASIAPWRLVYFHQSPYSSGAIHGSWTHECDVARWPFREWGASAVLSGHDHLYERITVNGLTYFVNGLGGESWDHLHLPRVRGSQKFHTADYGAMRIDATETNLVFRFINWQGKLFDTHIMTKGRPARGR